ncbi:MULTISPECIES: AAA family ATPase [Fictibacillus]|uniref:AAA family ATPase n=1 Tax=Fictibacillus TaxID=1329200 RepID=UPI00102A46A0|nr:MULTISPECIES: AAA family ATPase [Fictibacillus]RZT13014.1 pilus assembly protein CpaE [Fictibacillus sp. BK138]
MNGYKVLIVTKNESYISTLKPIIEENNLQVDVIEEWSGTNLEINQYSILFIDHQSFKSFEVFKNQNKLIVIGLLNEKSFELGRQWMLADASDVIILPEEEHRVQKVLDTAKEKISLLQSLDKKESTGKAYAFYSSKGGSGKTLLSAAVGQGLQIFEDSKVAIIDLNAQFGGLDTILGIDHKRSYYDLQPVIKEMNIRHIENIAYKDERTGNVIVLGPQDLAKAEEVTTELIIKLIRICKEHYDYVLLDIPSYFNHITYTALGEADHIYYILTPDSMGLRGYKNTEDSFARFQLGLRNNVSILLNRVHTKNELSKKDIDEMISRPIVSEIRADFFNLQPHVNIGKPFFTSKKEKYSSKALKDIKKFVTSMEK